MGAMFAPSPMPPPTAMPHILSPLALEDEFNLCHACTTHIPKPSQEISETRHSIHVEGMGASSCRNSTSFETSKRPWEVILTSFGSWEEARLNMREIGWHQVCTCPTPICRRPSKPEVGISSVGGEGPIGVAELAKEGHQTTPAFVRNQKTRKILLHTCIWGITGQCCPKAPHQVRSVGEVIRNPMYKQSLSRNIGNPWAIHPKPETLNHKHSTQTLNTKHSTINTKH